jgi:predicted aconitase
MHLSRDEENICRGERGESLRKMMEILVALGDIYGADRLIQVRSVQIAGVSFKNIGEAGLEWISDLQGHVVVPSILNPAGMDLCRWKEMGIDGDFAAHQMQVVQAYERLGVTLDCTCTPYQIYDRLASRGDHLAWSESSAVSYANSVIGAKTNREGGPSALASALIGKTPRYGYHLDENRIPTHLITVDAKLQGADYGALGILAGRAVKDGTPLFRLKTRPSQDELKALGAAMAASGSVALYYVENVTPSPPEQGGPGETIKFGRKEIDEVYEQHHANDAELVALGCPHCSVPELERVAELLDGRSIQKELWICTAKKTAQMYPELVEKIEQSGAKVLCDTCMVVSPASGLYKKIMVNSGKALMYLPGLCGVKAAFGNTESCIEAALRRD